MSASDVQPVGSDWIMSILERGGYATCLETASRPHLSHFRIPSFSKNILVYAAILRNYWREQDGRAVRERTISVEIMSTCRHIRRL